MASAQFLEEALSTDVDESAVNAIVGSLENQLVTSTPTVVQQQGPSVTVNLNHTNSTIANGGTVSTLKHGVTNGGPGSMNIVLNSDQNKSLAANTFQSSANVGVHTNVVSTVVSSLHGAVSSSGFITNSTNATSQSNFTQLTKPNESVKIVYPSGSSQQGSPAVVNLNNRVATFQTTSLPNGNLGLAPLSTQNVLNAVTTSNQSAVTTGSSNSKQIGGLIGVDHGKQTLVIKTGNTPLVNQPLVSVPMTINAAMTQVNTTASQGMSSIVTLPKPAVGSHQTLAPTTILPANVQIVNVNAVRAGTPGQQGQKTMAPRVVLGTPQLVGARPGQPGQITLQTLQGLQAGTQGHLLLKTENGQYQLLRVGPPPTTQGAGIVQNSPANAIQGGSTFRLQTVGAHGTVAVATTTAAQAIQSQPPALTTQTTAIQRHNVDTTKEKCRKFLANLLELSSREPKTVERNVRTLIQELIDTKVEPEEFCDRLERLLNASPQPCLIGFLKKSLPLLRQSLVTKELVIEGIRPPPVTVVFTQTNATAPTLQPQLRPQTTQVRVMAPGQTFVPRLGQTVQHRVGTPVRSAAPVGRLMTTSTLRPQNSIQIVTTTTPIPSHVQAQIRVSNPSLPAPPLHVRQQPIKTTSAVQQKPATLLNSKATMGMLKSNAITKPVTPSLLPKPTAKEKEKKAFHSAGYTGDDDINDVAAMGGVNLAEETQRILGSTEFVGRQIRSCKDEIFLHSTPLQQKIRNIVAKHGLEEPGSDVAALISHATQERLKNIVEKLGVMAEHRIDFNKADSRYEVSHDVKGQLKFLEELDRAEMKRHEEQEREMLWRAAKSRSKSDDPEQAKLKAKAKEIQRAEMEEVRQREANLTALQAIGSRAKKARLDSGPGTSTSGQPSAGSSGNSSSVNRTPISMRPRVKRVNLRDLLFLLEQEKETCRSTMLYKSFLK